MNYFLMKLGAAAAAPIALAAASRDFISYVLHDHELLQRSDLGGLQAAEGMASAYLDSDLPSRLNFIQYTVRRLLRTHDFVTLGEHARRNIS